MIVVLLILYGAVLILLCSYGAHRAHLALVCVRQAKRLKRLERIPELPAKLPALADPSDDRLAGDLQEGLVGGVAERPHPVAHARREDDGFHESRPPK
jgi:hypothetical protein